MTVEFRQMSKFHRNFEIVQIQMAKFQLSKFQGTIVLPENLYCTTAVLTNVSGKNYNVTNRSWVRTEVL